MYFVEHGCSFTNVRSANGVENLLPLFTLAAWFPPPGHVKQNACEVMSGLQHMTEAQCQKYAKDNGLKEHKPFTGKWAGDCKRCMQSGTTVAYNLHPSPTCKSSWNTVCDKSGEPYMLSTFLHCM